MRIKNSVNFATKYPKTKGKQKNFYDPEKFLEREAKSFEQYSYQNIAIIVRNMNGI